MQIRELMNPNVVSIDPKESAALAARLIARHNVGALPVCQSNGILQGMLTDRDIILRCVAAEEDPTKTEVRSIMTKKCVSVSPDDDIRTASHLMSLSQIRRLPVLEQGKLVGMLSLGDLAACGQCEMELSQALCEISENVHRPF
ncbi:MAG: CBS domain-containing protein [Evtepia sp.]